MLGHKLNVSDIVELIYAAGLDPSGWEAVVAHLGAALPFAAVGIQLADLSEHGQRQYHSANWEPGALETYGAHFFNMSPWVGVHHDAKVLVPYSAEETCPSSAFFDSEFYVDWVKPYKVGCGATAVKLFDEGQRLATLSMNYDEANAHQVRVPIEHLFGALVPHLRRAVEMNRRVAQLEMQSRFNEALLESFASLSPCPTLAPNCGGREIVE